MNDHRCFCDLAPLYALDLLDLEERLWVEAQILECPDLADELASYQAAVGVIPYGAAIVPMAADLKQRLFDRLAAPVDELLSTDPVDIRPNPQPEIQSAEQSEPTMVVVRSGDLEWYPYQTEGVEVAMLYLDPVNRMCSAIVKAADGIIYPLHQHCGIEEIYMLEGELEIGGQVYLAGDYIRSYPNSVHPPATTKGCKFFIRASLDDCYDENLINLPRSSVG
ncbi:cupin domain-containing protein [Chamaesiphon sp.]|uniref:cupin domain-containing protein n=1 Tax=Chamaesiphon sp. TaxID=2814140 RepID=UPI00359319B7